jgi:RimJ/RimL family protein N-acetyltransferase|tara:strand:+ start:18790 stop:19308 length:519 start_codon:yes stop_codon:yes gene_type:complete
MLEGTTVNFRALEEDDLKTLKKWRNNDSNRVHVREYRLLNMIHQKDWFEKIHKKNPSEFLMFGILDKKNLLIGVCGLTYIDWKNRNAEISIILSKKNWQKSKQAIDTLNLLINYGFGELNMHRLWVEIFDNAPQNSSLFKKMHFIQEGILREKLWRNGEWHNSTVFSLLSKR